MFSIFPSLQVSTKIRNSDVFNDWRRKYAETEDAVIADLIVL